MSVTNVSYVMCKPKSTSDSPCSTHAVNGTVEQWHVMWLVQHGKDLQFHINILPRHTEDGCCHCIRVCQILQQFLLFVM